jgi:hypothetical protein
LDTKWIGIGGITLQLCNGTSRFRHTEIAYSDEDSCPVCEEHDSAVEFEDEVKDLKNEIEDLKATIADMESE